MEHSHFIGDDGSDNLVIQSSAGENVIIDSADDIILDADGGDIILKDSGSEIGRLDLAGGLALKSSVSDADFFIQGNDGGSIINALQIDMSNGGSATFIDDIDLGGKLTQTGTGDNKFLGTVKISKDAAGLQQNLLLSNLNDTDGDAAGIAFSMLDNNTYVKGGLYFERTATQGRGDLVFLNNNEVNGNNASLIDNDTRMRITAAGEVKIGNEYTVDANGLSIEKTGNHIFLRATSATAGKYWNFDVTSNNELGILTNGGDGISIKDTGILQTPNGIVLAGNTVAGSITGVTLNDYEEGTWTPTILDLSGNPATLSTALGTYTKIGRQVILNYKVVLSSKGSMTGNYVHISGLPFNHATATNGTGTIDFFKNMANSFSSLAWDTTSTVTVAWLTGVDGTGASSSSYLTVAKLTDTTELKGSLIYTT